MKKYLIIIIFISTSYSQTNFQFDYFLEYNLINHIDSTKSEKVFYLTNSKDNSFFVKITEKDSLNYRLLFIKHDHLYSDIKVLKNSFNKGEIINIDCNNVHSNVNHFKFQVNNYDLINENKNDSIETFKLVCLLSEKNIKKKKIGYNLLRFNKNLPFHLPNFEFGTLYEERNKERDLPNNFVIENSFYDYNKKLIWTELLINYSKTNTKINIITKDCGELHLEKFLKLKQ